VDFGQEGIFFFLYDGLSGAGVVGLSDKALLGTLTGDGEGGYKYISRHPINVEWGY